MNLVSLLIATSVVKYSHNVGLRTGVALAAVAIVVAAVVISKRRSASVSGGGPDITAPGGMVEGPDSEQPTAGGVPGDTTGISPGQAASPSSAASTSSRETPSR
jgi:K(+)-stimulated pyrophosphate-energized sodium pump